MTWHVTYETIVPYVVKIETPSGFGTGFFFARSSDNNFVAISTALHVIDAAHDWRLPIKITHYYSGNQVFLNFADRAVLTDHARDSAAILITSGLIDFPPNPLPILQPDKVMKVGTPVGWVGYPALAPNKLYFFQGGVSALIEEDDSYLIDGVAINGVSGGPVFSELEDNTPLLIGIVSAYFANRQRGEALPGLLKAHLAMHLHKTIEDIRSIDDARRAEELARQEQQLSPPTTACPEPESVGQL